MLQVALPLSNSNPISGPVVPSPLPLIMHQANCGLGWWIIYLFLTLLWSVAASAQNKW